MGILKLQSKLILASIFVACGSPQATPLVQSRDSAGVRIVESHDDFQPPVWTVSQRPVLAIGEDNVESFGDIITAVLLQDGSLAVADAYARQIIFFDDLGARTSTFGNRGSGPGEFEMIATLFYNGSNRLGVYDSRLMRITSLTPHGDLIGSARIELVSPKDRPHPAGWLANDALVVAHNPRDSIGRAHYRERLIIALHDNAGAITDSLITVPGAEMWDWEWEMGVTPGLVPFGRTTTVRVHGNDLYVAANNGFQIDRHDASGRLGAVTRLLTEPTALPAHAVQAYKATERAKATSGMDTKGPGEIFSRMAEAAPYPELLAAYEDLLVDNRAQTWVRLTRTDLSLPTRFLVFDEGGVISATIDFPSQFQPTDVRDNVVIGIWHDEFDVESVRTYTIHTDTGGS